MESRGVIDETGEALVYGLFCSHRPTHKMLDLNWLDQRSAFENQFEGMSAQDRAFLLSFNRLEPGWSIYEYQDFPSVKWKLLNLERFKKAKSDAYQGQLRFLKKILDH